MVAAGARKGTLLFKGRIEGRSYIGEAHVFSSNCGPMAYPVEGTVSADFTRIELTGRAPRRNSNCVNTGWRDDRLVFTYLSKAD
jgi:hypothetical protein